MKKTGTYPQTAAHPAAALMSVLCALAIFSSCEKKPGPQTPIPSDPSTRRVLILYSAGHNNLSSDLLHDIRETAQFTDYSKGDVLLVYTHSGYGVRTKSYLLHNPVATTSGSTVTMTADTLLTFPETTVSASPETFGEILSYARENYPAKEYGLLFSSHGTGYLPEGYYNNSAQYENGTLSSPRQKTAGELQRAVPFDPALYPESSRVSDRPLTKSLGMDAINMSLAYEIDIKDFAGAIPFKLDYIILDACLMGGIEVAWELKDKTDYIVASPAEILASGMDYKTMTEFLWGGTSADLEGICTRYYNYYNSQSGPYRSATISLIDCNALDPLAEICKNLFGKYRDALEGIAPSEIQQFFTYSYHWFYDMGDIIAHLGCTPEELAEFNSALEQAIPYKANTPAILPGSSAEVIISTCSGLSMFLPCNGGDYLRNYYKSLSWNKATSLVE